MFLTDYWYVAAWSEDVGESLLARTILGKSLVLYRLADGTPVALKIGVHTATCRYRRPIGWVIRCNAPITVLSSSPMGYADMCRDRRRYQTGPGCEPILWWNVTAGCLCGWARQRRPMRL